VELDISQLSNIINFISCFLGVVYATEFRKKSTNAQLPDVLGLGPEHELVHEVTSLRTNRLSVVIDNRTVNMVAVDLAILLLFSSDSLVESEVENIVKRLFIE